MRPPSCPHIFVPIDITGLFNFCEWALLAYFYVLKIPVLKTRKRVASNFELSQTSTRSMDEKDIHLFANNTKKIPIWNNIFSTC